MLRFRGWCKIPYEGTKATMYLDDQNNPNQPHASHFADHDLFKVMYRLLGYVLLTGMSHLNPLITEYFLAHQLIYVETNIQILLNIC
jgi:hypothetical protein